MELNKTSRPPAPPLPYLVCFALPEERRYFVPPADGGSEILVTGMGSRNAIEAAQSRLSRGPICELLTCGFAGGLNPSFQHGDILWEADENFSLLPALKLSKSGSGQFHCAARIAVTAGEKARLRRETGADAVEMESGEIRALCRRHGIPSATIRVISDTAGEDLPLDFNSLANAQQRMNYFKLAGTLMVHPGVIPRLMRFHNQITASARSLGLFLSALLESERS